MKKKIALFGLGHLGKIHLKILKGLPQWEVVGVYDLNPETTAKVAETFGVKPFDDLATLLEQTEAVDIVTPTLSHFELAKLALEKGKHVFIEKPITHTLGEARLLIELAKKQQLVGQVGHVERFNPALLAIENRELQPMFIEVHRLAQWNPRGTDVSVVLDLMIHDLDVILSIVKSPIMKVEANGIAVISETPDICNARIAFANGCVANVTTSRISMKNMRKIRFFQKDNYFSLDFLEKKAEIIRIAATEEENGAGKMVFDFDTGKETKKLALELPEAKAVNAIQMELEEFHASISEGKPVRVSFQAGYEALGAAYLVLENMNTQTQA